MKIGRKQLDSIREAKTLDSQRSLFNELRRAAPTATAQLDDANLMRLITQATAKAERYGITDGESTSRFVKLAVFAGINFDEEPNINRFLLSPELDPNYKVVLLSDLLVEHMKRRT